VRRHCDGAAVTQPQLFLQCLGTDGHGSGRSGRGGCFPLLLLLLLPLQLLGVGGRRAEASSNEDGDEEGEEEEHD